MVKVYYTRPKLTEIFTVVWVVISFVTETDFLPDNQAKNDHKNFFFKVNQ